MGKLLSEDREEDRRPLNRQESKEKSRSEWKDLSSRWRQRIGTDRAMRGPPDAPGNLRNILGQEPRDNNRATLARVTMKKT